MPEITSGRTCGSSRAGDDHRRLLAVIGHATSFWTWRSPCFDHGLPDTEAVDAMTGMVLTLTPVSQAEPPQVRAQISQLSPSFWAARQAPGR